MLGIIRKNIVRNCEIISNIWMKSILLVFSKLSIFKWKLPTFWIISSLVYSSSSILLIIEVMGWHHVSIACIVIASFSVPELWSLLFSISFVWLFLSFYLFLVIFIINILNMIDLFLLSVLWSLLVSKWWH